MARVEVEAKEAEAHLGRWRAAVATTAAARGAQRLLGALVQPHQFLDWQNARTKRVLGLTYLQGTGRWLGLGLGVGVGLGLGCWGSPTSR